jgi:hypothetical protein
MARKALKTSFKYVIDNRTVSFKMECERGVVRDLGVIVSGIYVIHKCLGHPRDDQGIYMVYTI